MHSFRSIKLYSTYHFGRFQFSVEKLYQVRTFILHDVPALTISLPTFMPSLCPAIRGNPRLLAQRPFPSMIIATWCGILSKFVKGSIYFLFLKNGSFMNI